jgi:protein-disulfide isomerase
MHRSPSSPRLAATLIAVVLSIAPGVSPSFAQAIPRSELMRAGPLGEETMGSDQAPVTIIEYASPTCSHCAHFADATFPKLKKDYIDTGKVRYILREFPFDPLAASAFMLARCAPKDDYFSVIGLLFRTQQQWAVRDPIGPLLSVARQVGFTKQSFKACLADQKVLSGIEWVRDRAIKKLEVDATPTFFINGRRYVGDMSIAQLDEAMQSNLGS